MPSFSRPSRCYATYDPTEAEQIMTRDAKEVCFAAIAAVDPYQAVERHFQPSRGGVRLSFSANSQQMEDVHNYVDFDLQQYDQLVVIAFGKASSAMARAAVQQLEAAVKMTSSSQDSSRRMTITGVVVVKDGHGSLQETEFLQQHGIQVRPASHPVPDDRSMAAAQDILDLVQTTASPRTLVVCCISGGGSALFCLPHASLTLDDLKRTNQALLGSGLTINDVNVIRKRLEQVKGGRLAMACHPSSIVTLVLSDVLGDPLDLIASGPTVPDTSTAEDAWTLVSRHPTLLQELPASVIRLLQQERDKESLKNKNDNILSIHPVFENPKCQTVVVGNNEIAVLAAAQAAKARGYQPVVLGTRVEGEAQHVAHVYTAMAHYLSTHLPRQSDPALTVDNKANSQRFSVVGALPAALIAGGETTVTLGSSDGRGGRNQELALAAALQFKTLGLRNVVLASVGTDGTDGPTDAAGAVVDGGTIDRLDHRIAEDDGPISIKSSLRTGKEALASHDAYTYLKQTDERGESPLICIGATGTNVADICVTLIR